QSRGATRAWSPRLDQRPRPAGDHEVLPGGHDHHADTGTGRGHIGISGRVTVGLVVDARTEPPERGNRTLPDLGAALADPPGEDDRVEASEGCRHRPDAGHEPVHEHVDRETRPPVPTTPSPEGVSEVTAGPGQPEQTGPPFEEVV